MRILIADRNQLFNRLVSMKLEKWGHHVDIALTGDEAVELLGVNNYRMVILDWGLEGVTEDAFCQKVRQSNGARYTYILFYSERNDHDSIVAAYEAGADDYLFKPFNPQLLLLRIKTGKRMLNLEDELRTLSSYDAITGLISYGTFKRFFQTFLAGAIRHDMSGTVLFFQVSNFASVSRDHGAVAASKLMVEVAQYLPLSLRASDLVAKVDDDQFCALLPQTPEEHIGVVLGNLRERLAAAAVVVGAQRIEPLIDVYLAAYPVENLDAEGVLAESNRKNVGILSDFGAVANAE